jgi:TonB family protein
MEKIIMKNITLTKLAGVFCLALLVGGSAMAQEIHVTQAEAVKAAKDRVQPDYPPMAKQLHLEGNVQVQAHISESGAVEEVKPLTGNAVLMNAAVAALKKWRFTPFTADGKPARAVADMSFSFKL